MSAADKKIMYDVIQILGKKYKFDPSEAYEYADDVMFDSKPANAGAGKDDGEHGSVSTDSKLSAIDKTRKNIALWTLKHAKLTETIKEGKSKDEDKDKAARDKLAEKLALEKEKLKKQEAKEAKTAAPKEDKKPKAEPKKTDADEKRIKRMSPTLATQLKKCLDEHKVDHSDTKVFDKLKKEFVTYIDDLTEEDFTAKSLPDHMRDFAKLKETTVDSKEDAEEEITSAAPTILDLKTLKSIETKGNLVNLPGDSQSAGVYFDSKKGQIVTGPEEIEGEDYEEVTFEDKKYVVGENTGRVYEPTDSGADRFVGFLGIGKFKTMTR